MKASVEEDPETGALMLVFPEDFLEQLKELKWEIGDTVEWVDNQDGTWSIKKVE
jgi:5,10-methylenetetrahydrofolate reductase